MSLATDSIFITALQSNADLLERVGGRIYGTAIPLPDEDADNAPVPYLIVTFDGLNNDVDSKDDEMESDTDKVNISIEVTGETLAKLHDLTQTVRETILSYLSTNATDIIEYQFGAQAIQYDSLKPCYWQVLTYQCDVQNLMNDEQD
jgi:hypothetical protein